MFRTGLLERSVIIGTAKVKALQAVRKYAMNWTDTTDVVSFGMYPAQYSCPGRSHGSAARRRLRGA